MRLQRICDRRTAAMVASGVRRMNGVSISSARVISRPHYGIVTGGRLVGWIGIEQRQRGVYELCHLSVLPKFRRHGLAENACRQAMAILRRSGGHYAYTRVNRSNGPSINLTRKVGFRRVGGSSRLLTFGRRV